MNTTKKFPVLLVDDHILLRDALANLISNFSEFKIAAVAGNGKEAIRILEKGNIPALAILDLNMPEMDGYETASWLQDHYPDIKVLILTMYDSEIALIRLLKSGVRGFLKKDIHPAELRQALISVAENGYYYSQQTTGKLASLFSKSKGTKVEKAMLSDLEIEFLKLASTDLTYKEMAQAMKLTPRAIDNHRNSLFEKLDVKSRVGLAIYAVKNGIVTF